MKTLHPSPSLIPIILTLGAATLVTSCTSIESQAPKAITIDGSSTVYPITEEIAREYKESNQDTVDVAVNFSGTGGGFEKFCAGDTDISNASRPIKTEEMEACDGAGVRYIELPVAFDALTVVVNKNNDWVENLTVEELKKIWEPTAQGQILRWNQIRPDFPDRPINLFGPGDDSGTFDYFTEAIVGESGSSRADYVKSEDDDILVQGVSQDPNALGYFGLAYYEEREGEMEAIAIDSGEGAIIPERETVESGKYQPLARPLFIYVNLEKAQSNPALRDFVAFYLENAPQLVEKIGYIPLPEEAYNINQVKFNKGEVGTVFEGKSQFDLTIPELLRKQEEF
ncbi:MAG: PstS family phosphate ABC transporter substrate-binding protein [Cyanobacteriota bacterium]|nr:PstS family phosphate ABC transporter substrate-binding protein [Cyanobacteriota bacterium]